VLLMRTPPSPAPGVCIARESEPVTVLYLRGVSPLDVRFMDTNNSQLFVYVKNVKMYTRSPHHSDFHLYAATCQPYLIFPLVCGYLCAVSTIV
jgi:hypothetical protein